jgi:hypothetical protein
MAIPDKGIPAKILSKLTKEQFKPGDAVCFTWFNVKRYGYVKRFKEVNWGIQYTIGLGKMSYPCGIEVDAWKTKYTTGLVQYDETIRLGQDQLRILAESTEPMYQRVVYSNKESTDSEDTTISGSTGSNAGDDAVSNEKPMGTKRNSKSVDKVRGGNTPKTSTKKPRVKTGGHSNPDAIELGDDGMHPSDQPLGGKTKKTKKPSVEIQQNILSNFFKNID